MYIIILDQEDHIRDQHYRELLAWLSPLNFLTTQNDTFSRRQVDTGQWILEEDVFKEWLDGTNRILWCPGIRTFYILINFITVILIGIKLGPVKLFLRMTVPSWTRF